MICFSQFNLQNHIILTQLIQIKYFNFKLIIKFKKALINKNKTKFKILTFRMEFFNKIKRNIFLIVIIMLVLNTNYASSTVIGVTSGSNYTGVNTTYYFSFSSHSNPSKLIIRFSDWSLSISSAYSTYSISQNITGNSLNCNSPIPNTIQCTLSSSIFSNSSYPSIIVLSMRWILNPSSTKPYPIQFSLNNSTNTTQQIITSSLTVSQPRQSDIFIDNYDSSVSKVSNSTLYLQFHNYLTTNTILKFTYNTNLLALNVLTSTSYSIVNNSNGLKQITNWADTSLNIKQIYITITNLQFAVSFTISGLLTFIDTNGVQYQIQKYTITIQLTALNYQSLGLISPNNQLFLGSSTNSLQFYSSCSVAAINGPSQNSYFKIDYDNSQIYVDTTSTCIAFTTNGTKSSCIISIPNNGVNFNNSYSISKIKSLISLSSIQNPNVNLTISSLSYFSVLNSFYPICSSTISINVIPQIINPTVNLSSCFNIVGQVNLLNFSIQIQDIFAMDIVKLSGFPGKISNISGGLIWTYDKPSNTYTSVILSGLINSSSLLTLPISISNPTYIPLSVPSFSLTFSRKLVSNSSLQNIYAKSSAISVCQVNNIIDTSITNTLVASGLMTYQQNVNYTIQFGSTTLGLNDYSLGDYFMIYFKLQITNGINSTDQQDSPYQLFSLITQNSTPSVVINSQYYLLTQIWNSTVLKVIINSSSVANLFNGNISSLIFKINSLQNPIFLSDIYCILQTYNSAGLAKQKLATLRQSIIKSSNSDLNIYTDSQISLLSSSNNINLQISSLSNKNLFKAAFAPLTSSFLIIQMPFSCQNINSTNSTQAGWSSLITKTMNISLVNCSLGYFADLSKSIIVDEYVSYSSSNFTSKILSTSSKYMIQSTCGDLCRTCSSNKRCVSCFSPSQTPYNILVPSSSLCQQSCPSKTFNSSFICQDCHQICTNCLNNSFMGCTKCATNYQFNSQGFCQSICGQGMYVGTNKACQYCHPNCNGCFETDLCYLCKDGAVLVNNTCVFSRCNSPCLTCQSSVTNCLTCIQTAQTTNYFYQNSCYSSCPENTFQWENIDQSAQNKFICIPIKSSKISFIGIVLCFISLLVGIGIRCLSKKKPTFEPLMPKDVSNVQKMGNDLYLSTKGPVAHTTTLNANTINTIKMLNLSKTDPGTKIINSQSLDNVIKQIILQAKQNNFKMFKLNVLRFQVVLMAYVQILCIILILAQGGQYNPNAVNYLIYAGFAILIICNALFTIKYFKNVYKKLATKRQKFIQMNIKQISSIKIQSIKQQPLKQEKQDNSNEQNMQSLQNQNQASNEVNPMVFHSQISTVNNDIKNQQNQLTSKQKLYKQQLAEFDNQMVKQLVIVCISGIFTFRTYNILRSNLFSVFVNDKQKIGNLLNLSQNIKSIQNLNQNMKSIQNLNISNRQDIVQTKSPLTLPNRQKDKIQSFRKIQGLNSKKTLQKKKSITSQGSNNIIKVQAKVQSSRKVQVVAQPLQSSIRPFSSLLQSSNSLLEIKQQYINKFMHPFYTYLIVGSMIGSLLWGIGALVMAFKAIYQQMVFMGIDTIIVVLFSILLNITDLWKVLHDSHHQQHQELSQHKQQVNQTMENLNVVQNQIDQINVNDNFPNNSRIQNNQNDFGVTKKISTINKFSGQKSQMMSPSKSKLKQQQKQKNSNNKQFFSSKGNDIDFNDINLEKSKSPKSPYQKTQKLSPKKQKLTIDRSFEIQQKHPQLKVFDDLDLDNQDLNIEIEKFTKAQKVKRKNQNQVASKVRSSYKDFNPKKTQIATSLIALTSRGGKQKNKKLQDIYLAFMEPQIQTMQKKQTKKVQQKQHKAQQKQHKAQQHKAQSVLSKQINQSDQMSTVKMQSHQLLNVIKSSQVINIHSDQQIQQYKQKPAVIITDYNNQ